MGGCRYGCADKRPSANSYSGLQPYLMWVEQETWLETVAFFGVGLQE